jgi:hypothetical protein
MKGARYPVVSYQTYLFALSPIGPVSLLHPAEVTLDAASNGYVTTDSNGQFNLPGFYAACCPTPNSLVYVQEAVDKSGYGGSDPTIVFATALVQTCSDLPNAPFIFVSEVTTVVGEFTLAPFIIASDNFTSSGANAPALANAFAQANAWVNGLNGNVLATGLYAKINTLGDILSECVNTTDTNPCATLFADTTPPGGTPPADVLYSTIDLPLNPANNAAILYTFYTSFTTDRFYTPTLPAAPIIWALLRPNYSAHPRCNQLWHSAVRDAIECYDGSVRNLRRHPGNRYGPDYRKSHFISDRYAHLPYVPSDDDGHRHPCSNQCDVDVPSKPVNIPDNLCALLRRTRTDLTTVANAREVMSLLPGPTQREESLYVHDSY